MLRGRPRCIDRPSLDRPRSSFSARSDAIQPSPSVMLVAAPGELRLRITGALNADTSVSVVAQAKDMSALAERLAPAVIVVYLDGLYDGGVPSVWLDTVRQFHNRWPDVCLLGLSPLSPPSIRQYLAARTAGLTELAIWGTDNLAGVVTTLADARMAESSAAAIVRCLEEVTGPLPDAVTTIVRCCAANAHRRFTVEGLAGMLGLHRRTLAHRLAAARLPTPESLIMWTRILALAWLLRNPARSVSSAARELGYYEPHEIRGLTSRYLARPPLTLRHPDALITVVRAMIGGAPHRSRRIIADSNTPVLAG